MQKQTFAGRYESLAKISLFAREAAQKAALTDFEVYTVETAVDEACSNIIEHAYQGKMNGNITIQYQITKQELIIKIFDTGKPFDPDNIPPPEINCDLYERKSTGLGIYMMRQWMDSVHYDFHEGHNVLTMIKNLGVKV